MANQPINDEHPDTEAKDSQGNTTYDLSDDAREALEIFARQQAEKQAQTEGKSDPFNEGMSLRIEVGNVPTPLVVIPEVETLIGRRDPIGDFTPEIDLTPYAGYQMGVSRRHARIEKDGNRLVVVDLASRNGTFVNNKRLAPHQPYPLNNGDELRIGKIAMRVIFKTTVSG